MRKNSNRVIGPVNPTTEIQKFLCLKLLRVKGNRIIAKQARDSSGSFALEYAKDKRFIKLSKKG
jgi:hypothetical protein